MATVAEIKELKREDLDKLAVEQGLDPAQFSKKEDLQAELLKSADDADSLDNEDNSDEQNAEKAGGADPQNTTTKSTDAVVSDVDRAANAAEQPTERKAEGSSNHPASFDKYGQPVFGKGK